MLRTSIDHNPVMVNPDMPLLEVVKLMSRGDQTQNRKYLSYVLISEREKLLGILTERDIVKITANNQGLYSCRVSDVMTKKMITSSEAELNNPIYILSLFKQYRIRHLPILNEFNNVLGVVTSSSIRTNLQSTDLFRLRRVEEGMSTQVITAFPDQTVYELVRLMASQSVSCVVITEKNSGKPIGILTERDIVQIQSQQLDLSNTLAKTVMSQPLYCLHPDDNLWNAHQTMKRLEVRRLVISDSHNRLTGILTQSSILAALDPLEMQKTITVLQKQVEQLQDERTQLLQSYASNLEDQVKLSEQRFQAIFNQAFQFIGLLEPDGTLIEANYTALKFGGCKREDVINKPFWEGPWWQTSFQIQQQLKEAIHLAAQGKFIRYEVNVMRDNNQVAIIDFSLRPIQDDDGQVILIIPEGRDITDIKKAEAARLQSEQNFSNLAKAAPVGIFHTDLTGSCLYVNEQWCQITGVNPETAQGKGWLERIHPDDQGLVEEAWYSVESRDQPFSLEFRFRSPSGKVAWVYGQAITQADAHGKICGYIGTIMNISERKYAELALQKLNEELEARVEERTTELKISEARYKSLYQKTPMMLHSIDQDGKIEHVSDYWLRHLGYKPEEVIGHKFIDFLMPDSRKIEEELTFPNLKKNGFCPQVSYQILDKKGYVIDILLSVVSHENIVGQPIFLAVMLDVTERNKLEKELFREKELAQVTLHSIGDAVITTNASGVVEYINPVAEQLTGWDTHSASGKPLPEVFHIVNETMRAPVENPIDRALRDGVVTGLASDTLLISKDGTEYGIEDSAAPIRDRDQTIVGAVLVFHDVTQSRRLSHELSWQASHDDLTALANRRHFESELDLALQDVCNESKGHVLCFLDLDQFKVVNDTCGHLSGDELLQQIAKLLKHHIRTADILARLGGDEFGILLKQCPLKRAQSITENIRQAIHQLRFQCQGKSFNIGVSIGLVALNVEHRSLSEVMSEADAACYAAKEGGRNRIHTYQSNDSELVKQRGERRWSIRIREALEQNQFCLFSQEIVENTDSDNPKCYHEILLRMMDEEGQIISPGVFIPSAERFNLMNEIDRWVIDTFFRHLSMSYGQSRFQYKESQDLYFINLSGTSLNDAFLTFLKDKFTEHSIPPKNIGFEITETAAISHLSQASHFINELKAMGCSFALDDFGSGFSSFSYLKTLPVDYLKIDGSFILDIVDDPATSAIVESINHIGHVLDLKTIAEYVENDTLREHRALLH